jgi:hypothetical protein
MTRRHVKLLKFTPIQNRLVKILRERGEHGMRSDQLVDKLYADDPEGGPEDGFAALRAVARRANAILKDDGFKIMATDYQSGGPGLYRIMRIDRPWRYPQRSYTKPRGRKGPKTNWAAVAANYQPAILRVLA